jgi:hypothetical protein
LTGGAVEYALAIGAELTGGAFITTGSTVIDLNFGIGADTEAIGEISRTCAISAGTDLTTAAFIAAGSTVIGVAVGIDTRAGAGDLTAGAGDHALAVGTDFA